VSGTGALPSTAPSDGRRRRSEEARVCTAAVDVGSRLAPSPRRPPTGDSRGGAQSPGPFEEVQGAIERATELAHRQVEEPARSRPRLRGLLQLRTTTQPRGRRVRHLRPATTEARAAATEKLKTHSSTAEKPSKPTAKVVGSEASSRSSAPLRGDRGHDERPRGPEGHEHALIASVVEDAARYRRGVRRT